MVVTLAELGRRDYGDALDEAQQCRHHSALFDFSFMYRARVSGPGALRVVNSLQSRDPGAMQVGSICYGLCSDYAGAVEADVTVWKLSHQSYEIYSGRYTEIHKLAALCDRETKFEDLSNSTYVISLQGPASLEVLASLTAAEAIEDLAYFRHRQVFFNKNRCQLGRLGYTGERGFEIIVGDKKQFDSLWLSLSRLSRPAGMAAVDILRIEAGFILFLNECRFGRNVAELGLEQFASTQPASQDYQLVCFRAEAENLSLPWAPGIDLELPQQNELSVTSACPSVVCDGILGLGWIRNDYCPGDRLQDRAGKFKNIEIVKRPYFDSGKSIPSSPWRSPSS